MINKRNFVLFLCTLFISTICVGQSRPIHFAINEIMLGQSISHNDINGCFRGYEIDREYSSVSTYKVTLKFKKSYSFDGIPVPVDRLEFLLNNGRLATIIIRTYSSDNNEGEVLFKHFYSLYGIHDVGPHEYPHISSSGPLYTTDYTEHVTYKWLGSNGVTLSLWGYAQHFFIKYEGSGSFSSNVSNVLNKLNGSSL